MHVDIIPCAHCHGRTSTGTTLLYKGVTLIYHTTVLVCRTMPARGRYIGGEKYSPHTHLAHEPMDTSTNRSTHTHTYTLCTTAVHSTKTLPPRTTHEPTTCVQQYNISAAVELKNKTEKRRQGDLNSRTAEKTEKNRKADTEI